MDFNFKEVFENIKDKVLEFVDRLVEYYEENQKKAIIIAASVLGVLIILVVILICASGKKDKKNVQIPSHLELTEKPVIPDGPVLPRDYNISRKTKDKWSEEDADQWFTVPSDKEIDALSKSNDAIINEIVGAAP